jgi:hypothetical protein
MQFALVAFLLFSVIFSGFCSAQSGEKLEFNIRAVDKSADPCADFTSMRAAVGSRKIRFLPTAPIRRYSSKCEK